MVVRSAEPRTRSAPGDASGALPLAAVSAGALVVASVANPDTIEDGPILCPFRLITGLPCPGCGLTRSWVYLVHGRFDDAFTANPFGLVTLIAAVCLIVAVAAALVRRRPLPSLAPVFASPAFKLLIGVWIGFAGVRLAVVAAGG